MVQRIITLGDSTMQFNPYNKFPQTGWPQALVRFIRPEVEIKNFAVNGKSTKNFIELKLFEKALNEIGEQDLVLIEFGHNDQKIEDPTRYTKPFEGYQSNLREMVECCTKRGAHVILLTPIAQRNFKDGVLVESHGDYPKAMMELASQMKVPCIDLYTLTKDVLRQEGEELSKRFYMNFGSGLYENHPSGLTDDTHLRYDGAFMVANCFYKAMKSRNLFPELFLE
ncbi:MAG TPA: rhamnogalacturonan acetylesterase [Candidatus Pelethenecus faecipullorum]|uniref:Rhamnogalacturonan acetylesterase n=1 Tax=Candidatus Pelethenecus faecipullorum TaxID=2840900 RepID=A0A9D1GQL0_9MOLU|nr:rhamnogalacturonan acetylesterase [Candidatus Pelethenecus faecipullorum]